MKSDILKADNLAKVDNTNERTNYAKKWESIEEYFGEDFDNFLSQLRTILVKQKAGYNLLKEYEDNIYSPRVFDRNTKSYKQRRPLLAKGRDTFNFINTYYKYYIDLFEDDNFSLHNNFELSNYLTMMSIGLEADYWIAALLHYYHKFKYNSLIDFIKALDNKFSCDWIIGLSPTLRIENVNAIIKRIDSADIPNEVIDSNELGIDINDLKRILNGKVYGRRYARYLLIKLDLIYLGHTTKFSPPQTISIEHILPQNPNEGSAWVENFSEDNRDEWTDRLGNLVLIASVTFLLSIII